MAYRWDPFGDITAWRDAMDRFWRESTGPFRPTPGAVTPPLEVSEDADEYRVRLALPGVKPEDVHIQIEQNILTVAGEFRPEEAPVTRRFLHQEHQFGSFSRAVSLPSLVDTERATAQFEHGMLIIRLPKHEKARARRIPIGAARTIEGQVGPADAVRQAGAARGAADEAPPATPDSDTGKPSPVT